MTWNWREFVANEDRQQTGIDPEDFCDAGFAFVDQDDWDAKDKARELLRLVLPGEEWSQLETKGVLKFRGQRALYVISPYSQTEIRDTVTGRCVGHACLQLSIPAPTYDRVAAEYLLLKNSEDTYWKTANIFEQNELQIIVPLLTFFDVLLFVYLLLEIFSA
jgi:hypothetical protein